MQSVAIIGFGKVGSILTCKYLELGYKVFVFEKSEKIISDLENKIYKMDESIPSQILHDNWDRLFINDWEKAILEVVEFHCIVPTPSEMDGSFDLKFVLQAWLEVAQKIFEYNKEESSKTFILKSTVSPGSCSVLKSKIESEYPNQRWELIYNPEFIALGDVYRGLSNPDIVIIGVDGNSSWDLKSPSLVSITEIREKSNFIVGSYPEIEIAKLAVNTFVTSKISFANLIGQLLIEYGSKDPTRILNGISQDKRIGSPYFRPGLGYGGPCFPRDNKALAISLKAVNLPNGIPVAVDNVNDKILEIITYKILDKLKSYKSPSVIILGLSYKPGTGVIEKSQASLIANAIHSLGYNVVGVDPLVDKSQFKFKILQNITVESLRKCDLAVLAHNDPTFDDQFSGFELINPEKCMRL